MTQADMPDPPSADRSSDRGYLIAFLVANLLLKFALVPLNLGEYTDGILQLRVFQIKAGLYPPLFGALAWLVSQSGFSLEMSGRIVSAVAGALCVVPVFVMTSRMFGRDAARISAVLFTVSPLILRWSTHAMTDALFLLLTTTAMHFAITAWRAAAQSDRSADSALSLASASAALATLTRYQGILLIPLLVLVAMVVMIRTRRVPVRTLLASASWLLVPLWIYYHGFSHSGQFTSRTAGSALTTLVAYWNTLESFIVVMPYYFGYPVVALALAGMAIGSRSTGSGQFILLYGLFTVLLLLLHAMFGSFQYRYLMPALPGALVLAGHGAHQLYRFSRQRRLFAVYSLAMGVSLGYLVLLSVAVLSLQRGAYGDQKEAARFVSKAAAPGEKIFANERYGDFNLLGSIKLSFWTGRQVEHMMDPLSMRLKPLPVSSWVIVGNHYGGEESAASLLGQLGMQYSIQEHHPREFNSELVPLHDDIMVSPLLNQNPLAWVMRYAPQRFYTRVFQVTGPPPAAR